MTARILLIGPDADVTAVLTALHRADADGVVLGHLTEHRAGSVDHVQITMRASAAPRRPQRRTAAADGFTARELQVLRGIAADQGNRQIGRALALSEDTVKTHNRQLFRKLGVTTRAGAVNEAWRRGILHAGTATRAMFETRRP